ncbi:MAG: T9SS type A sorting domain-containing protein [Crocinitomicaceae bacterium]
MDLSKFAQGMYFMRVTRNNEDRVFKIIKL